MHHACLNTIEASRVSIARRWIGLAFVLTALCGGSFSPALSASPQNKVSNVFFENDGEWLIVRIETEGSWAHWTLGNPARIIVDVSDAVSNLPNAPSLFEKDLTSGPVRRFRTSQFSNTALDRRVRLTLELSEPTAYEASRRGREIQIRIRDDSPAGALWGLEGIEPAVTPTLPDPVAAPPAATLASKESLVPSPADTPTPDRSDPAGKSVAEEFVDIAKLRQLLADSIANNSPKAEEPAATKPEVTKPTVTKPKVEKPQTPTPAARPEPVKTPKLPTSTPKPTSTQVPDVASSRSDIQARIAAVMNGEEEDPGRDAAQDVEADLADSPPKETVAPGRLSAALASVFEPVSDPAPVPRLSRADESTPDPVPNDSIDSAATEHEEEPAPEAKPALQEDPVAEEDPDLASADDTEDSRVAEAKSRLEEVLGTDNEDADSVAPPAIDISPLPDLGQAPESWGEADEDEEEEDVFDPTSMHAVRAAGLLVGAVQDWIRGDLEGAYARADRIHRYYPESPAGQQAGLLVAEIHHLRGDEARAEAVQPQASDPDPELLPLEFFSRLLENLWIHERFDHLSRRLNQWNELYPRDEWFADFHYRLGTRSYRLRESERAEFHLALVPEGNAREPKSLLMRARLFDEADDAEMALALYEQLADLDPHGYAQRGLSRSADLHFQLGRVEKAHRLYQKVRGKHPTSDEDAWALYQIGNCQWQLGDEASARLAYAELVNEKPTSYWFEFAEERLKSLEWSGDMARRMEELSQP